MCGCSIMFNAPRLMGSRIIELAAYCNQILLVTLYRYTITFGYLDHMANVITFMLSKAILLSDGHCILNKNFALHMKWFRF